MNTDTIPSNGDAMVRQVGLPLDPPKARAVIIEKFGVEFWEKMKHEPAK